MGAAVIYTCDICNQEYPLEELHAIDFKMDWNTDNPIFMQRLVCHDDLKARLAHFQGLGVSGGYIDILAAEPA